LLYKCDAPGQRPRLDGRAQAARRWHVGQLVSLHEPD
jgi:hypothetical protein